MKHRKLREANNIELKFSVNDYSQIWESNNIELKYSMNEYRQLRVIKQQEIEIFYGSFNPS